MLLQRDGRIIVARIADPARRIVQLERLNADGSLDPSFSAQIEGAEVTAEFELRIILQSDGKVLVRGSFSRVNGIERKHLVRLTHNGSLDETFRLPENVLNSLTFNSNTRGIAVGRDGRILALAYRLGTVPESSCPAIVVLKPDGNLDFFAHQGVGDGAGPLLEQPDGKWLVGAICAIPPLYLQRMNPDGSLDRSFGNQSGNGWPVGTVSRLNANPSTVALQSDGKILVTGSNLETREYRLFRLSSDTQSFSFRSMTRLSATQVKLALNGYYSDGLVLAERVPSLSSFSLS